MIISPVRQDVLPAAVCVPCHPDPLDERAGSDEPRVRIELRERRGETVAIVFSSVRCLVEQLGQSQPWMVMDSSRLQQCLSAAGVTQVLLDPVLGDDAGRWTPEDIERFADQVNPGEREDAA